MSLNYLIWGLFGPIALPFWLIGLGLWRRRYGWAGLGLALALAVHLPIVGHWAIAPLENRFALPDSLPKLAAIAVLGGGEDLTVSAGRHRPEFTEAGDRLREGVALALAHPKTPLLLVGGVERGDWRDVRVLGEAAKALGVPDRQRILLYQPKDTAANAQVVADWLKTHRPAKDAPVLLVTSAFHMPRAVLAFEAAGVTALPYPVDYRTAAPPKLWLPPTASAADRLDMALHEWVGLAYYRLSGKTARLWPEGPKS